MSTKSCVTDPKTASRGLPPPDLPVTWLHRKETSSTVKQGHCGTSTTHCPPLAVEPDRFG
eukprot:scaffold1696_cov258-Pinguiococcus_pyrenoidosus.AAC.18